MIAILVAVVASAIAAETAGAVSVGAKLAVKVTPKRGTPRTRFIVRFRTPYAIGKLQGLQTWEIVNVRHTGHTGGCRTVASSRASSAALDANVRVTLAPGSRHWCAGSFRGAITLYRQTRCGSGPIRPMVACPQIAYAPQRIGTFRLTVRRRASSR